MGGKLFFTASDAANRPNQLYSLSTGGTPLKLTNNTNQVKGLGAGANVVYFITNVTAGLYRSDGTVAGTYMLGSTFGGSPDKGYQLPGASGKFIFPGWSGNYTQNGVVAVTTNKATGNPSIVSNTSVPEAKFYGMGSKAYFTMSTEARGTELWATDGTSIGTAMVLDVFPGTYTEASLTRPQSSYPKFLSVCGSRLYFTATDFRGHVGSDLFSNYEPWYTDATYTGTVKVSEVNPLTTATVHGQDNGSGSKEYFPYAGRVVFSGALRGGYDTELWVTDGTANGTSLLKEIKVNNLLMPEYMQGSNPCSFCPYSTVDPKSGKTANWLYFFADDWDGTWLYATNGVPNGTTVAKFKLPHAAENATFDHLMVCNGYLFFMVRYNNTVTGANPKVEMWRTDGTAANTRQVLPASAGYFLMQQILQEWVVMDNWLYFSGNFDGAGYRLYKVQ